MGEEREEPTGPDLALGVALEELGEGQVVQGQADGEAVVMVRAGGEVYAVDAGCTHYGVSLGGGVVVGHTLRCPAHHSRFDVRTGEAVAAPAFRPLGCWNARSGAEERPPRRCCGVGAAPSKRRASFPR